MATSTAVKTEQPGQIDLSALKTKQHGAWSCGDNAIVGTTLQIVGEELCEALTWSQLGIHAKPCGALNIRCYFDDLQSLLDRALQEGFLRPEHRKLLVTASSPIELLDRLEKYEPAYHQKWPGPEAI